MVLLQWYKCKRLLECWDRCKFDWKYLNFIEYEDSEQYFLTIDLDFVSYLKSLSNSVINIKIDISNINKNIMGIDLQNFNFSINSFEIDNVTDNFLILNQEDCNIRPVLKKAV